GAQAVFDRLVGAAKPWAFWLPPLDEDDEEHPEATPPALDLDRLDLRDNELLCADLGRQRLLRVLTNLYRRSGADYRERGLHILYVACGVLEWRDQENAETFRSPLGLVPVELRRNSLPAP